MVLTRTQYLDAIAEHSRGLADAAAGALGAPVPHCPGWCVADLVAHVRDVHAFWATIVARRLTAPPGPGEVAGPGEGDRADLVSSFLAGSAHLVDVLAATEDDVPVWTWAPGHHRVGFVTRHQVQEAAVHHVDAVLATGGRLQIAPAVADDAVAEFLQVSLSSAVDPAPGPPADRRARWCSPPPTRGRRGPSATVRGRARRASARGPKRPCPCWPARRRSCCCGCTAARSWTPRRCPTASPDG